MVPLNKKAIHLARFDCSVDDCLELEVSTAGTVVSYCIDVQKS